MNFLKKSKLSWKQKDNSNPDIKIALRLNLLQQFPFSSVLDVYGGYGFMYEKVYKKHAKHYESIEGDAIKSLMIHPAFQYSIYDVDPYGSPFEALEIIANNAVHNYFGIVCTDGSLRRSALMRTPIKKSIINKCGFDQKSLSLKASIYHQYPSFLRFVLSRFMPTFKINQLIIKYGMENKWNQATVYFSAIMERID